MALPHFLSPQPTQAPAQAESFLAFTIKTLILVGIILAGYLLFLLLPILTKVALAGFVALLLLPTVEWLRSHHVREVFGILLIYTIGILIVFFLAGMIVPVVITEVQVLVSTISDGLLSFGNTYRSGGVVALWLPTWMIPIASAVLDAIHAGTVLGFIRGHAGDIGGFVAGRTGSVLLDSVSIAMSIGDFIFSGILILILAFFILIERSTIYTFIHEILPTSTSQYLHSREGTILTSLSAWLRGQIILSISIATTTYIGLSILALCGLGIPERGTFALIAGCFEFVPVVGPILAFVPAFAAAITISWSTSLAILILYITIQQAEGNILFPMIMGHSVELSPLTVFIAMLVGAVLGGIMGVILAVPVTAVVSVFVRDWMAWKKRKQVL